jgi:hypothetical protein
MAMILRADLLEAYRRSFYVPSKPPEKLDVGAAVTLVQGEGGVEGSELSTVKSRGLN